MTSFAFKVAKEIYYKLTPDSITYNGIRLPPKHLRYCGKDFHDNGHFLKSSIREANRLMEEMNANQSCTVLDIGCGVGRLAIGLKTELPNLKQYYGVDISKKSIAWCKKYLESSSLNYKFILLDMKNDLYNKDGKELTEGILLPFKEKEIDIIYLYSVFSHMKTNDIVKYLKEFKRILNLNGKIFFTAFVEEDVENEMENPKNYIMEWSMPLHCVRFNRRYLEGLLEQAGFKIYAFEYALETDRQSGVYVCLI